MTVTAPSILFVCTGNIFRSVIAEFVLKEQLGPRALQFAIGSAGIRAGRAGMDATVAELLSCKGIDARCHRPRPLSAELMNTSGLVVAMAWEHRAEILYRYGRTVPLFKEICLQTRESILDVHEAVPNWCEDEQAARRYVLSVVDDIRAAMPALVSEIHAGAAPGEPSAPEAARPLERASRSA